LSTINESGLYALIFRSRKPSARLFRRWVTGTVLPAIRKTGGYQVPAPAAPVVPQIPNSARSAEWRLKNLHWTDDDYPDVIDRRDLRLPGPATFPPARWQPLWFTLTGSCQFVLGEQISSMELARHLRARHPQYTIPQILRALPWMVISKWGVARSNDLRATGRSCRGYHHLVWAPRQPLLTGGAS
jgi:hypothetical protein